MRKLILLCAVCMVSGSALAGPPDDLKAASEALRTGRFAEAAQLLKQVKPETLSPSERDRYVINARAAAVRTGDRAWLAQINRGVKRDMDTADDQILTASDYLKTALYDRSRNLLETVQNVDGLPLRLQIRYHAVYARLERLTGNTEAERKHLEYLILLAEEVPPATETPAMEAASKAAPAFSWANWWPVQRYAVLLRRQYGVAGAGSLVKKGGIPGLQESIPARLRLASLQLAANQIDEANKTLATIPLPRLTRRGEGVTMTDMTAFP